MRAPSPHDVAGRRNHRGAGRILLLLVVAAAATATLGACSAGRSESESTSSEPEVRATSTTSADRTVVSTTSMATEIGAVTSLPVAPTASDPVLCRNLRDRGDSFRAAVEQWYSEGAPARMDVDANGVPCETVYPRAEIAAFLPQPSCPSTSVVLALGRQQRFGGTENVARVLDVHCAGLWLSADMVSTGGDAGQVLYRWAGDGWVAVNIGSSMTCDGEVEAVATRRALRCLP